MRSMKLYPNYLLRTSANPQLLQNLSFGDQPQKQKFQLQKVNDTLLRNALWTQNYMEQTWAQTKDATS